MAINGPLTNRGLVTFSLVKRMTELREENTAPDFFKGASRFCNGIEPFPQVSLMFSIL